MRRPLLIIFVCLLTTFFAIAGNPDIEQGWKHFGNNDLAKAKTSFKKALSSSDKHLAHLGLSLVGAAESDGTNSFDQYLQFYKTSPDPWIYVQALWSIGPGEKTEAELEFLESVAEKGNGTLKVWANQSLGSHYMAVDKIKTAESYYSKVVTVEKWQVVGEFENISESGFNVNHGPLNHPEATKTFKNKRGVDVKWFNLPMPRRDKWVDFANHFYTDNSIIYAQSFCKSPDEREVQFRLGTSGSAKVWVNDHLIFEESEERNNAADTYNFTAKLNKGYNRILIQIGASEINQSNFLLRVTDNKGVSHSDLEYSTRKMTYTKGGAFESKMLEDKVENFLVKEMESNPGNIFNYLTLTQMHLRNDMIFKARHVLKDAKELFNDCSYVTFQLIESYIRDDNRTGTLIYIEELKNKDPDNPLAQSLHYNDAVEIEDYDKAEEILSKIEAREGKSEDVYDKKIELAGKRSEVEKLLALVNEAHSTYPDNSSFVLMKYYVEKSVRKDVKAAIKALKTYRKKHFDDNIVRIISSDYFSKGDNTNGLKEYETLLEHNPLATGYYSQLASIYFSMGQYDKAEGLYEKCLDIAPYIGTYHSTLGKTYAEMDREADARKAYEKAINYNPYDYKTRDLLHHLLNESDIFSNFKEEDAYELFENSPDGDKYPEDHSIILLNEEQKVVYDGGGSEERHTWLIKVFNTSGVDRWKDINIPVHNNQQGLVEHAEVLKKDGSRIEAQRDGVHVVFPNLEPGDAVHLSFKLQNYYSGKLTNHFWDKFHFDSYYPKMVARYSLLVPVNRKFDYKMLQDDLQPTVEEKDKFKLYTWEMKDLEALKSESYMPSLVDIGKTLHVSSFEDWDYIAEWYADLSKTKAKIDFELQETATDIFEGQDNLSNEEKVKLIYKYIVNNIRYSSVSFIQSGLIPQKASRVIASKQGDCKDVSTLFVALCKTQGIDANLVLVNTRHNGVNDMALPSINFNHCIAKVNLNNEDYYVEMTSDNLPFASASSSIKNVFTLEIPKDQSVKSDAKIINPKTRVKDRVIRKTTMTFSGDDVTVSKKCVKSGVKASSMRSTYKNEGEETQFKYMQEAITGTYPNLKLSTLEFTAGLNDLSEEVQYMYEYVATDVFTEISGLSIFKLPWADSFSSPDFLSSDERKFAIELWRYFGSEEYEEVISVKVPSGKSLSEVPENRSYINDYVKYSLTFTKKSSTELVVTRRMDILEDIVSQEDYTDFKDIIAKIVKADEHSLAFK